MMLRERTVMHEYLMRPRHLSIPERTKLLLQLCLIVGLSTLAITVGLTALGSATGLAPLAHPLALLDAHLPGIFRMHMLASGLALSLLPAVLLLHHRSRLHRPLGRVAAGLLGVGALAALPTALASEALPLARLGFFVQGILCLMYLAIGYRAARRGNASAHRLSMMSVAALVAGVVLLRIMLAGVALVPLPFDTTYAVLAWLSWTAPLSAVWLWHMYRDPVGVEHWPTTRVEGKGVEIIVPRT
jgi:uncharacterized membrane protein